MHASLISVGSSITKSYRPRNIYLVCSAKYRLDGVDYFVKKCRQLLLCKSLKLISQSCLILIHKIKTNKNKQKYVTDYHYQKNTSLILL